MKVVPTFGQPAVLGGMFTQYQDMFLPGLSLWKPKVTFINLTHPTIHFLSRLLNSIQQQCFILRNQPNGPTSKL